MIKISAKVLGQLALPNACPRCFWLGVKHKLPWQIFPGIFSSIDSYSKKITKAHMAKFGIIPAWMAHPVTPATPLPMPKRAVFRLECEAHGIVMTGAMDELLKLSGIDLWIVDYKTARYTKAQDTLLPMYRVQLNGYADIMDSIGDAKVKKLSMLYYEPATDMENVDITSRVTVGGMLLPFIGKLVDVERDTGLCDGLMATAAGFIHNDYPPDRVEGCKNCGLLDEIGRVCFPPATAYRYEGAKDDRRSNHNRDVAVDSGHVAN